MTRLEALKELAEKVEAGAEYLDRDIQDVWGGYRNSAQSQAAAKAYHGSLDAALALHEAVLPGWRYAEILIVGQRSTARLATNAAAEPEYGIFAVCHNPARAWLLAVLRALIAQDEAP